MVNVNYTKNELEHIRDMFIYYSKGRTQETKNIIEKTKRALR